MDDLTSPLSEREIERLDQFLLDRVDENILTDDMDEGIFDISTLDGFLTAIISGPITIPPSVWLPSLWGDFEPVWESEEAFSEILTLLLRHMNGIIQTLMDYPDDFEPLYMERIVEDKTYIIVDEWCEGYHRGVELTSEHWLANEEITVLLAPIYAFTEVTDWKGHDYSEEEIRSIQNAIAPNVRDIYTYWLEKRANTPPPQEQPVMESTVNNEPKVGRNDPCPCGSGKKYKKCCLH
jgi:uncharacterized protein